MSMLKTLQATTALPGMSTWDGSFQIVEKPKPKIPGIIIIDDVVTEMGDTPWEVIMSMKSRFIKSTQGE